MYIVAMQGDNKVHIITIKKSKYHLLIKIFFKKKITILTKINLKICGYI